MPLMMANITVVGSIDWLLGLDRIRWSDPRAVLTWHHELASWQWGLVVLGAAVCAILAYRHLIGPRPVRVGLGVVRALVILTVAALLAGPMVKVLDRDTMEDWLLVLVDRSASMTIEDARLDPERVVGGAAVSRDAALRGALQRQAKVFGDPRFVHDRQVAWLGFDTTTRPLDPPGEHGVLWDEPAGQGTGIRTAIEQALQRAAGRPLAGIVLISDGRTAQSTGPGLVRRLTQRGARVFVVPVGGDLAPLDVAVGRVVAPKRAFIKDDVPVAVDIELNPADAHIDAERLRVRLVDALTEKVLDERPADGSGSVRQVVLSGRSASIGPVRWHVEAVYDAPDPSRQADPVPLNNRRVVEIEMLNQPVRVLYVEGYPRWEYRFLQSLLVREKGLSSSMMLLSADASFAQEGDEPITRLPTRPQEWSRYDVVIMGDVPPEALSADQMAMLRDHVAVRGAGLLWVGGEHHTPHRYEATPLADALPMRQPGAVAVAQTGAPVAMFPWPAAAALNVLQLGDVPGGGAGWPAEMPPLWWAQDLGPLKSVAEVLAASASDPSAPEALPLVVRMRFGSGQSVYVATDETWRWRRGRGEAWYGPFWTGLLRMLGRHRIQQGGRDVGFELAHRRIELGQHVVVEVHIEDAMLLERDLQAIEVSIRRDGQTDGAVLEQLALRPQRRAGDAAAVGRVSYRATWRPTVAGRLRLRVTEPALDDLDLVQGIEVMPPDAELRHTRPDHERLAALAADTGGAVIPLGHLDRLVAAVTSRAESSDNDLTEPMWDSPLALILVLLLLTVEWVGRKLVRLV